MAKETANTAETPVQQSLNLTFEQLQKLMTENTINAINTFVEAQKKPSAQELRRKELARDEWLASITAGKKEIQDKQNKCTHMHRRENRSAIARSEICFPRNAWLLICQKCHKTWANFDSEFNPVSNETNPEFVHWWLTPSLVDAEG